MSTITTFINMIVGGILFSWIFNNIEGVFVGMALGFLLGRTSAQKKRLQGLEKRLEQLEQHERGLHDLKKGVVQSKVPEREQDRKEARAERTDHPTALPASARTGKTARSNRSNRSASSKKSFIPPASPSSPATAATATPVEKDLASRVIDAVQKFFTEGNVVLRVGLLVLFFGVAFLLKYATEHNMLSIELRLLGVALAGIALLLLGWRQRLQRSSFALLMQGGGIGLLFLDVFAAFRLYHLLPAGLAFAVMLGLVCTSAALALVQDAKSLALFGATGGFLAPVLLSTGSGNHLALFSYYALLNTGILFIAWFKAWRGLNLLGFFFTLGIGSFWGLTSYEPRYFASTEPFLLLFFLMFTLIGVLFAFRQPPQLRGYVDGSLIFGTPIICFSLQAGLVKDIEYGLAISALLFSLFYIGLARFLWDKGDERLRQGMRTLTEALLALGVVFATLAVPLALSGRWTAVTWALEATALIWLGVRQDRLLPRNCGLLLALAAGVFFLNSGYTYNERLILLNGTYFGAVLIGLSALFSSWYLYQAENLRSFERYHHLLLFVWGMLWWLGAGVDELGFQIPFYYHDNAVLFFAALSCAVMIILAQRLSWSVAAWPSLFLLPLMLCIAPNTIIQGFFSPNRHFFAFFGWLAWPLTLSLLSYCLYQGRSLLPERLLRFTHIGGFLLFVLILTSEAVWVVRGLGGWLDTWELITWALVPLVILQLVQSMRLTQYWPLTDYAAEYQQQAAAVLAFLLWLWLLASSLHSAGHAHPLPFLPICNPLELSQVIVLLGVARWLHIRQNYISSHIPSQVFISLIGATIFVWLNTVLARAVHQFATVPFTVHSMLASQLYQSALAVLWGSLALIVMVTAHSLKHRTLWLIGAGLVALTVLKLFLIDLANSGTVERIVSFVVVGILLMLIGYFAPLPPADSQQEKQEKVS
ncbi:MAG: DUF2339 domain-containing protein [Candidatus Electrothrix sp. LOE1_4_5]|nr:DUF2339 domain-containing protein [Candidatus Electrothrix gigas]